MPLTHLVATRLGKKLTDVRKDGSLWWLRPDGKTQVTVEYKQKADGSVEPQKMHTVVISTQHAAPGTLGLNKSYRSVNNFEFHIEIRGVFGCITSDYCK